MKITIGSTTYTKVKNISFSPDADLTGDSLPINEFTADIVTDDSIAIGGTASLYDDADTIFAQYVIMYSEVLQDGIRRIKAQSIISALAKRNRDLEMYDNEPVTNILADIFLGFTNAYTLDPSLSSCTVTGYCPPQTCRERLQWICFIMGAYVKSAFNTAIQILPLSSASSEYIPLDKTYWRPYIEYKDYVTSIRVRAYSYEEGDPEVTDTWISGGLDTYYIETYQDYTLTNSAAPVGVPDNEVTLLDMKIVNEDNVDDVLSRMAAYYFNRDEITLSVINNGDYHPGDNVTVHTDEDVLKTGYIKSAVFTFGLQAKSTLKLIMTRDADAATLVITRTFNSETVKEEMYHLPVGYSYSFQNPFLDKMISGHRYILRPTTSTVSGTIQSGTNTEIVTYAVALDYYENILHIVSVDDSTEGTAGEVEIE